MPATDPKREKLSWYWRRIRRVPFPEIPYRLSHLAKKLYDKSFAHGDRIGACTQDSVTIDRIDISNDDRLKSEFADRARPAAERICAHQFDVFGINTDFGPQIDWHLDPKTGRRWPIQFWGDVNYRDGSTIGGIKFAWELNRLHHFPQLAIACALTGDPRYEKEMYDQLRSWLSSNPYPLGINWISGIELGIRIVNLVFALKILPNPPGSEHFELVRKFVYLHATHLYRYPSKYTSGANHAVAEALGLFAAGVYFPGFSASKKWKRFGQDVLEREAARQIYPDGSSFEHSFPYLQFVFDHFLVYMLICIEREERYSDVVPGRLRSSLHFIASMLDDHGNFAAIGDDDAGYLLKLWFGEHNNFTSLLKTGAALLESETPEWVPDEPDLKTKLLTRVAEPPHRRRENSSPPSKRACVEYFQDAGLAVVRITDPINLLFVGNSGPLGLKPLAAHGHADALSFWLSVENSPIFVDPGTYLYHSGGRWRDYFRSTAAHNTIRVDGIDQAPMISDFMFDEFYTIHAVDLAVEGNKITWTACHDGYRRIADPVEHRRTVSLDTSRGQLLVEDRVTCNALHTIESFLHVHPSWTTASDGSSFCIRNSTCTVTVQPDSQWQEMDIISGNDACRGGWYSRTFNSLQEATTLRFAANVSHETTFLTVIDCAYNRT